MAVPLDHEIRFCSLEREIWPWQRTRLTKVQGLSASNLFKIKSNLLSVENKFYSISYINKDLLTVADIS